MLILKDANIVNVYTGEILNGSVGINNGKITFVDYYDSIDLKKLEGKIIDLKKKYISPTFIDGHIHIESSHTIPSEFEKYALLNGVSKVVIDPHEIANVLGVEGIDFMLNNAKLLEIYCMVPSCVPATKFESNGASITAKDIENLFKNDYDGRIVGLGEVMDYISVIDGNEHILEKINIAKKYKKLIDGHAPQLRGLNLNKYIENGSIMSDHESVEENECLEKIRLGLRLMIRDGTVSKNIDLLKIRDKIKDIRNIILVSDDISIKDLKNGYLLNTLRKSTRYVSPIEAIQMVTINPANYFGFDVGIKPSNSADLIIFNDLYNFEIDKVMIKGKFLDDYRFINNDDKNNKNNIKINKNNNKNYKNNNINNNIYKKYINTINYNYKSENDFLIDGIDKNIDRTKSVRVIEPIKDSLITKELIFNVSEAIDKLNKNELNRIYVIERHRGTNRIGKGIIHFLRKGTVASSYSHDSHNVVVVGNDLNDIKMAVNYLKDIGGGFVIVENGKILDYVKLDVAGIMATNGEHLYEKMESIEKTTKDYPIFKTDLFLTLSFLTLSVIPELKITDFGLIKNNKIVDLVF